VNVVTTDAALRSEVAQYRANGQRIALVPTMGNLHAGHLSLVEIARRHADIVIATIFVNPMQFAAHEDLDQYPRTLEADLGKLQQAETSLAFTPSTEQIYPDGVTAHTQVAVPGLTDCLCGASRPGHFDGVTTIVCKLFNLVQPEVAVFGKKDLQQLLIIQKMAVDLAMNIKIIGAPIVRADDGLALSSRNQYLTPEERRIAPQLHTLMKAAGTAIGEGEQAGKVLASTQEALCSLGFDVDYLELRSAESLRLADESDTHLALFVAARLGTTRLIDNLVIER
jgi:pantoate--beta-alanine ligase